MVLEIDPCETSRFAWSQADHAQPVGSVRRTHPVARSRRRSQEHHRIRFVRWPAGDIDGMVHLSDLSWDSAAKTRSRTSARATWSRPLLPKWTSRKSVSLWRSKRLTTASPKSVDGVKRGSIITVAVTSIEDGGVEVEYEGMKSFIRRSDLAVTVQSSALSALQLATRLMCASPMLTEDPSFGSVDQSPRDRRRERGRRTVWFLRSGASLGDILGAALKPATNNQVVTCDQDFEKAPLYRGVFLH